MEGVLGHAPRARLREVAARRAGAATLLGGLVALSVVLRTRALDASFWIDEGLSVGIASRPFTEIPGTLKLDGSPPGYYLLLHLWTELFGTSEEATRSLSLLFALAAIPVAFWAGRALFGHREGWVCAALAAVNPFLSVYAQETRMYTLVVLLSLVASVVVARAFVTRDRRYLTACVAVLTLMLYTHNWAFFFCAAVAVVGVFLASRAERPREILRDLAIVLGTTAVLYLPWLSSFLFQLEHTGAPWSRTPTPAQLGGGMLVLAHSHGSAMALVLAGGVGLAAVLRARDEAARTTVYVLGILAVATLLSAWVASQFSPAWANRYLAVMLGPVLLLAGAGLARAGRLGAVAFVLVAIYWCAYQVSDTKSNAKEVAAQLESRVEPGDLLVSTHPEQIAVLHYYLGDRVRYATTLGPAEDPRVMDWRDAMDSLRAAEPRPLLDRFVSQLREGRSLVLVTPVIDEEDEGWEQAPWTALVRSRSSEWERLVAAHPELSLTAVAATDEDTFKGVCGGMYMKTPRRSDTVGRRAC